MPVSVSQNLAYKYLILRMQIGQFSELSSSEVHLFRYIAFYLRYMGLLLGEHQLHKKGKSNYFGTQKRTEIQNEKLSIDLGLVPHK